VSFHEGQKLAAKQISAQFMQWAGGGGGTNKEMGGSAERKEPRSDLHRGTMPKKEKTATKKETIRRPAPATKNAQGERDDSPTGGREGVHPKGADGPWTKVFPPCCLKLDQSQPLVPSFPEAACLLGVKGIPVPTFHWRGWRFWASVQAIIVSVVCTRQPVTRAGRGSWCGGHRRSCEGGLAITGQLTY